VAPQELVRDARERVAISGHEGRSGAGLERVRLADGRLLVVKRIEPGTDFTVEADLSREDVLAAYRDAAGPAHDDRCERLSLLAATLWLGWNKALDAIEHPDPRTRARERDDLDWWIRQSRTALEEGVL
jgi:hypothetical protein